MIHLPPPSCVRSVTSSDTLRRSAHIACTLTLRFSTPYHHTAIALLALQMLSSVSGLPVNRSCADTNRRYWGSTAAGRAIAPSTLSLRQRNVQYRTGSLAKRDSCSEGVSESALEGELLGVMPPCVRVPWNWIGDQMQTPCDHTGSLVH